MTGTAFTATASQPELLDALGFVKLAVFTRAPIPVLAGVRMTGLAGLLTLDTTNFEVFAAQQVEAPGADGKAVVSHADLLALVKSCDKDSTITLTVDGAVLTVTDGEATFTLDVLPADDFPARPDVTGSVRVLDLTGAELATVAARVAPTAGTDDTLPALTAVNVDLDAPGVLFAATDRYRLAVQDTGRPALVAGFKRVSIPAKTFAAVAKALKGAPSVGMLIGQDRPGATIRVDLMAGTRVLSALALEAEFPRYERLFPADFIGTAELDGAGVVKGVKRLAPVLERNAPVRLELAAGPLAMAAGGGSRTGSVKLPGSFKGDPMTVAFNPAFLVDGVAACGGKAVRLQAVNAAKPSVLTSPDAPGLRYLLMPVRIA